MPNWCQNKLTINAPKEVLEKFINKHFNNQAEFDFATIIPEVYDDDGDTWYDWRIAHWGTKWNACDTEVAWYPDTLVINFNTAWSPSIEITRKLFELYPDIEIEHSFYEGGVGIAGKFNNHMSMEPDDYEAFAEEEGFYAELL